MGFLIGRFVVDRKDNLAGQKCYYLLVTCIPLVLSFCLYHHDRHILNFVF